MSNHTTATSIPHDVAPPTPRRSGDLWRVAGWWLASRAVVMAAVLLVARLGGIGPETHPLRDGHWVLDRFAYWDSFHVIRIAEDGYFAPGRTCCDQSWFPVYPMLMRALRPVFLGSTVAAGIAISVVASTVAALVLWRLVLDRTGSRPAARWAVVTLAAAPYAVFLVNVYTEALWLAAALAAWWAAQRRHWWLAGLAAALATGVRVNGLFLVLGLGFMYLMQMRDDRRRLPRLDCLALGLPLLSVFGYFAWLHAQTGSWRAWQQAQVVGWNRTFMWPWQSVPNEWSTIVHAPNGWLMTARAVDLACMVGALLLVVVVARWRQWDQLAYLVVSVGAILTSPNYGGTGRYALTWFPAYLALATFAENPRTRWVPRLFAVLGVLLMVLVTCFFALRHWIG